MRVVVVNCATFEECVFEDVWEVASLMKIPVRAVTPHTRKNNYVIKSVEFVSSKGGKLAVAL